MNKLEAEFKAWYEKNTFRFALHYESITLKLANGTRYTPDFSKCGQFGIVFYEVKGKWFTDDSNVKIKVAANQWPEFQFWLAWKQDGQWQTQRILP